MTKFDDYHMAELQKLSDENRRLRAALMAVAPAAAAQGDEEAAAQLTHGLAYAIVLVEEMAQSACGSVREAREDVAGQLRDWLDEVGQPEGKLADFVDHLGAREERLRAALAWYAANTALAANLDEIGAQGRYDLVADAGKIAKAALDFCPAKMEKKGTPDEL